MANVSKIKLPNNSSLDVKALAIPIGTVDSTSTSTVFTFTVPGITSLYNGVIFAIRNTVVASASGWTANVNGLGAKQVYGSNNTRVTTGFAKNYWYIFVYDEANDRWTQAMLTDANSTYTNVALGQGYGTCTTAAATTAKVVTLASYALTTGGIVAVKFDNDVPANATMNINSKGAKAIYHRGAAITAGVIKGGDTAYFIYSTYYHLLGVDRIISKVSDLTNDAGYTTNIGTITGITMNGVSKGTSGVVDLGTVVTSDEKVKQSPSTDNSAFEVLLSGTADNTERTEITKKSSTLKYNPSTKALVTGGTVDGYTLNAAAGKAVDSSIAAGSTSTNLPTSAAVASALSGKQNTLVSGTNIKTVNNESLLGSGNIALNGGNLIYTGEDGDATIINGDSINVCLKGLDDQVASLTNNKQAALVSGTNIKTINNNSLLGSGNISVGTVTGSSLTANNIILGSGSSAIKSSGKTIATTLGTDNTTVPTSKAVKDAIDALPEPMIFQGTLGTGGTITSLPAAAAANTGYTYKVITDGTYQSIAAKAGDTFISNGSSWTLIPSGDEPSGTVTNIATGTGLTGGPITTTGTIAVDTSVVALKSELSAPHYLVDCATAADVVNKEISIGDGVTAPVGGTVIDIRFTNGNSVDSPKLSINGGTARSLICKVESGTAKGLTAYDISKEVPLRVVVRDDNKRYYATGVRPASTILSGYVRLSDTPGTDQTTAATPYLVNQAVSGIQPNVQSDWNATSGLAQILNKPTIPAAVTESTVSGWGFTKNTGTVTNVATGTGLTGGPITTTGTIAIDTSVVATKSDLEDYMLIEDYETDEEVIAAAINDLNDKIASKQNTISDLDTIRSNAAAGAAKVSNVQSDWNATSGAAVILNKPSIPEGNAKIFYGTCDTAAATTAKVVTCADFTSSDLVKGALIFVKFDYTNSGAVANLTLNVNGTGAKPLKKQYNVTGSNNLVGAGELVADSTYLFQYNGTNWICMTLDYNSTYTLYNLPVGGGNYKTSSVLYRYELLFQQDDDTFTPLNNVNNGYDSVSKTILTNVEFDPFGIIYYYGSTSGVSANGYISAGSLYYHYGADLRYTFNISTTVNALTTNKNVYLKVSPQSNGKVKLASATPLVQDLPTTNDGYYYIFLGRAYSTYQIILYTEHPVYCHNGKEVVELLNPKISNNYALAPIEGGVSGGSVASLKWGKIFEYCFDKSGTIDSASTFLFTQYNTTGTGYSAKLLITVRSNNKTTNPQTIVANWTDITSDFDRNQIAVTWCIENNNFYIRIYGRANGWARTTCGILLNQHAWVTNEKDPKGVWTGYSGFLSTTGNEVIAFDSIPSTETAITIGLKKLVSDGFIKNGGTSSQFLKADGSVDSNTYLTSAAIATMTQTEVTNTINTIFS